jgi:hypothetical protein
VAKIKYKGAQIIFWDLGGQSKMRTIWERYYNSANAVVFVVDSSDADRWAEAKREFEGILAHEVGQTAAPVMVHCLACLSMRAGDAARARLHPGQQAGPARGPTSTGGERQATAGRERDGQGLRGERSLRVSY